MKIESFLQPAWLAPDNVHSLITLKAAQKIFSAPAILLPALPIRIKQLHGTRVIRLPAAIDALLEGDAVITTIPKQVCAILTADCLPIFLSHKNGLEVGVIHAGWRGLAAGIISQVLAELTYNVADYSFWLGPCISEHAFEVGEDLPQEFLAAAWNAEIVQQAFLAKTNSAGKFWGNLQLLAKHALLVGGAKSEQISSSDLCTFNDNELFHSYRRDKTLARMQSLIWIRD